MAPSLHIAAVLAADLEECLGDLAEGADLSRVHQRVEQVVTVGAALVRSRSRGRAGLVAVPRLEIADAG